MQTATEAKHGRGTESVVYLIGLADRSLGERYKIGHTIEINHRLKTLMSGSPFALAVYWTNPGGKSLERFLHERFAKFRIHGEWFDFTGQDVTRRIQSVADLFDADTFRTSPTIREHLGFG